MEEKKGFWRNFTIKKWIRLSFIVFLVFISLDIVYVIVTTDKLMIKRLGKVKGKDYWAPISNNEEKFKQFKLHVDAVKELWKYRRHIDLSAPPPKKFEIKV